MCLKLGYDSSNPLIQFELVRSVPFDFAKKLGALLVENSIPIPPLIAEMQLLPAPTYSSSSDEEEPRVPVPYVPEPYKWYCNGRPRQFRRADDCISVKLILHTKDTIKLEENLDTLVPNADFKARRRPKVHVLIGNGTGRVPYELNWLYDKLKKKSETEMVVLFLALSPLGFDGQDTFSRFGDKFLIIRLGKFSHEIESGSTLLPFLSACKHAVPFSQFSLLRKLDLPNDFKLDYIKLLED